ncbi:uncharacterized protein [Maniola hyperantus]|uniref:uncharacterized protein n=1 Tax=Aphantopus hyperantus TaxID=2795564 RepID=UPI0037491FB4
MCIKSLKSQGVKTETWDLFINYVVVSKLDTESVKLWEQDLSKGDDELPTWEQLKDFLEARFRALEMVETSKAGKRWTPPAKPKAFHVSVDEDSVKSDQKCAFCNINNHYIFRCKRFSEIPTKERQDFVQRNRLCFNCLSPSHSVYKCRRIANCRRCGRRHHSLLHFEKEEKEQKDENAKVAETTPTGVGEGQTRIKHMVSLIVESRHNPRASVCVNAYVLRSLTTLLPTTNLSTPEWSELENLELADPGYTTPGRIDILLGAEVYSDILLEGIIKHPQENLLAQKTILGWVLSGKMSEESTSARRYFTSLHINVKEDEILKQFWELENEPNSIVKKLSREERILQFHNR